MKTFLETLAAQLLPTLTVALSAALCALVAYATSYLKSKTKNINIAAAFDRFNQVAESAVNSSWMFSKRDTRRRLRSFGKLKTFGARRLPPTIIL